MRARTTAVLVASLCLGTTSAASAQYFDDTEMGAQEEFATPENFAVELRVGTYQPDIGAAFDRFFGTDQGPLLAFEFDYLFLRLDGWLSFGLGTGFGWVEYDGKALTPGGTQSSEDTRLTLNPIPVLAVLRIDALARQLEIPLLLTGKFGGDFVLWNESTGSTGYSNVSIGMHWAVQAALELDFFERRAARALDEQWGINHTFVFFEVFGSTAESTLPVGPKNGWAWSTGLGLIF
jgi:hypothetical protein